MNGLGIDNFISTPGQLPPHVETIAFIDDVALSGQQAAKYLKKDDHGFRDRKAVLLTFMATKQAVATLKQAHVEVIATMMLDDRSKYFHESSVAFAGTYAAHRQDARDIATHYGAKLIPHHPLGFSDGQYGFGFFYNTPDNALPIFWSVDGNWKPIIRRYEKITTKLLEGYNDCFV